MVDIRSTANSKSEQRETIIMENFHQCFSAPTESLSEEKPERCLKCTRTKNAGILKNYDSGRCTSWL